VRIDRPADGGGAKNDPDQRKFPDYRFGRTTTVGGIWERSVADSGNSFDVLVPLDETT